MFAPRLATCAQAAAISYLLCAGMASTQNGGNFFAGIDLPAGVTPTEASVGLGYLPGFILLQVESGDFNNDGKRDLVATGACSTTFSSFCVNGYAVAVYLGNGDGTFQAPVVAPSVNPAIRSLAVADFNGDGNLDVALQSDDTVLGVFPSVTVLLGDGHGNLAVSSVNSLDGAANNSALNNIAIGDFNADGKLDLAVSTDCSGTGTGCTVGNNIVQVLLGIGDGTFVAPVLYTTAVPNTTSAIVTADFNGDGKLDLVLTSSTAPGNQQTGSVTFLQGNGDGSFQPPITTSLSVQGGQFAVAADFNADGKIDIAFTDNSTSVDVLLGQGNGSFQAPVSFPLAPSRTYPSSLAVADFNGDGSPDLVVAESNSVNTMAVLLNNGSGSFTVNQSYPLGGLYFPTVVAGDFNDDGNADIISSSFAADPAAGDGIIGVLLGNGDGSMQGAQQLTPTPVPLSLIAADLNGDGISDLVGIESCYQGNCSSQQGGVIVLLGLGNDQFGAATEYPAGMALNYTNGLAVGDLNGDGKPDVVVSGSGVAVLLGAGGGSLATATVFPTSQLTYGPPGLGDFAGNGKLGVAVVHQTVASDGSGAIGVLLGNGDGSLQPETITNTPDVMGYSLAVGDFNHDGKADVAALGMTVVDLPSTNTVTVFLGHGDGNLSVSQNQNELADQICSGSSTAGVCLPEYPTFGTTPTGIATADVNGDGNLDLVVANECAARTSCQTGSAIELLGVGTGAFTYGFGATAVPDANLLGVSVADVNGDGIPDLIAPTLSGVAVWLGQATSFLTGKATVYASLSSTAQTTAAVGDLNGDGSMDIAVANGSSIAILYNRAGGVVSQPAATVTTVASSTNPSLYGAPLTLTATVTASGTTVPGGAVTFSDGSNTLGIVTLSGGAATLNIASLAVGTHPISAVYSGNANFATSASSPLSQVVSQANTTATLASSANPAYVSQTVTFTAAVASQYGGAVTGAITFKQGTTSLATVPLAADSASFTTTYTGTGTRSITAVYSGDANDAPSTSVVLKEVVKALPAATTTTISTSGSPSFINQAVTFVAQVVSTDGAIPNGETISFYDGANLLGAGTTSGGSAALTTSSLTARVHTIKAAYPGDSAFKASSATLKQTVNLLPSTTKLAALPDPSTYGQSVALTATVTSSAPGGPTGKVTFVNGATTLGTVTLNSGSAVLVSAKLPAGSLTITAMYKGDAQSARSSGSTSDAVTPATSATALATTPNPSKAGQNVKLTATVTSPTATAVGVVSFLDGATVLATVNLSGGKATYSTSALTVGTHNISATYAGTSNISGSGTPAPVSQVVE